jgi:hypothetical protein
MQSSLIVSLYSVVNERAHIAQTWLHLTFGVRMAHELYDFG